ncbi:beta-ketoacyl-ACP synthase 3 [Desertihabitans brevis]|uniref:Beta-ketoacyl-ACP synthase 3 n=1 Tax=Desertihabitans brevis TaxID=2268447 RepID=A0A367YSR8_9ACTN|nr:beta-ketoacyl-ACP synthase 3 [Desertihabitans brevis]RCK68072.1 beta-ketoacyl-ACP synthase 3 [Desertihabitans brevis]
MIGSRVVSLGHFQPARVVPNSELEQLVETSDEWISRRVGIRERRWAGPEDTVVTMATAAARDALAVGRWDAADVDLVLVATCTNAVRSPNTAAAVAHALGMAHRPATLDVNVACSGFPHALALAQQAIAVGSARTALVIGSEKLTDFTDFTDRTTCVLTADGAGAMLVTASEEQQISPVLWGSVPELGQAVRINPDEGDKFAQDGRAVFRWTTFELPAIAQQVVERAGIAPSELAAIVLHQANLRIIEPLAAKIGAEQAVVATDVTESGNTSAASIPLALSKLLRQNPLPPGAPVLLFAFGGGLAYAGQVVGAPEHQSLS